MTLYRLVKKDCELCNGAGKYADEWCKLCWGDGDYPEFTLAELKDYADSINELPDKERAQVIQLLRAT